MAPKSPYGKRILLSFGIGIGLLLGQNPVTAPFTPAAAHAAPARAALKTRIEHVVGDMLARATAHYASDNATLKQDGQVLVEDGGRYFAVTLPHLSVEHADKSRMDIGIIAMNIIQGDNADEWKVTAALPTPITIFGPQGDILSTLHVGGQNLAGVYSEKLGNFSRLNARYQDVVFTQNQIRGTFTIPDVQISQAYNQDGEGLWSGRTDIALSGARTAFQRSGAHTEIAKTQITLDIARFDPVKMAELNERMAALSESVQSGDSKQASTPHKKALLSTMAEYVSETSDASGFDVRMEGIDILLPASPRSSAQNIHMDAFNMRSAIGGFLAGQVFVDLAGGFGGLRLDPAPAELAELTPSTIRVQLRTDRLPFERMVDSSLGKLGEQNAQDEWGTIAHFLNILSEAGALLQLRDTAIGNADYHLEINSQLNAQTNAAHKVAGTLGIRIRGMDVILKNMQAQASLPELSDESRQRLAGLQAVLALLQMAGQPHTDEQGRAMQSYQIEIGADGLVTLNGQDISPLLGATGLGKTAP